MNPAFNIISINIENFNFSEAYNQYNLQNIEKLKCFVCNFIANNPVSCQKCQAFICQKCLSGKKASNSYFNCSKCSSVFSHKNLTFSQQNDLNKIKIKCPNKECIQSIPLIEIKKHIESCSFSDLISECNFCKKNIATKNNNNHKEIYDHLKNCVLAMIYCEFCNMYFLRNTLYEHKKYCINKQQKKENRDSYDNNFAYSQQNVPNYLLNSNNNLNNLISQNNNKFKKCNICNVDLPVQGKYSNKIQSHVCRPATQGRTERYSGNYEAESFYGKGLENQNYNNFMDLSNSNLNPNRSFYGADNKNLYENIYQNYQTNNNQNFQNTNKNFYNNNKNICQNSYNPPPSNMNFNNYNNNDYLTMSSNNIKMPAYSNLNVSYNNNRYGNERYRIDSDSSFTAGGNHYLESMENFNRHNQSDIKNLLKNNELEISKIKREYENKINAMINTNMGQNQNAKKHLNYKDEPLTINDLKIESKLKFDEKDNNINDNNDKDLSIVEYSFFKNELEKLDEKNFASFNNKRLSNASPNKTNIEKKEFKDKSLNVDQYKIKDNHNDKYKDNDKDNYKDNNASKELIKNKENDKIEKINDEFINDDLDIFEFSDNHISLNNPGNDNKENNTEKEELNLEDLNKENKINKNKKDQKVAFNNNNNQKEKTNYNYNIEVLRNLHSTEKEKMKREYEKALEITKQDYLQQIKDFIQTMKEEYSNNPSFNKMQYIEDVFSEVKKSIKSKEDEIFELEKIQNKYISLSNENTAVKENYEKNLEKLSKEIINLKSKNDEKIFEIKEEKQKEIVEIMENNETTIIKIKENYENLITLIRKEKDNEIKKLISKYDDDFKHLKIKNEASVENIKKEFMNKLETEKKNFEVNDLSSKEINESKLKNLIEKKNKQFKSLQKDIFEQVQKSLENAKDAIYKENIKNDVNENSDNNENNSCNDNEKNQIEISITEKVMKIIEKEIQEIIVLKDKLIKDQDLLISKDDNNKIFNTQETKKSNSFAIDPTTNTNPNLDKGNIIEVGKNSILNQEEIKREESNLRSEQNKKNKTIDFYQNKSNDQKKKFEPVIIKSLNNTMTEINNTQNNLDEKKDMDNMLSKSNNVFSIKELRRGNGNISNGEHLNTDENRNFENSILNKNNFEKLKMCDIILKDYFSFFEEMLSENNKKIDILIGKSQLEIK